MVPLIGPSHGELQDIVFRKILALQRAADAPLVHHGNAVAHPQHLFHVAGDEKHGGARIRGLAEAEIDFVPRADIQGRALMVFYPCRPFAWLTGNAWPGRFGFVR